MVYVVYVVNKMQMIAVVQFEHDTTNLITKCLVYYLNYPCITVHFFQGIGSEKLGVRTI